MQKTFGGLMGTLILSFLAISCGSNTNPSNYDSKSIDDAAVVSNLGNNHYQVTCKDGTKEVLTQEQLLANNICNSAKPTPPLPPPHEGIFESSSCSGTPFQESALYSIVGVPQNLYRSIGSFQVFSRSRLCYNRSPNPTLCASWSYDSKLPHLDEKKWPIVNNVFSYEGLKIANFSSGQASLSYKNDQFYLDLIGSDATMSKNYLLTLYYSGAQIYGSPLKFFDASANVSKLAGILTDRCFWLKGSSTRWVTDEMGNQAYIEQELVINSFGLKL